MKDFEKSYWKAVPIDSVCRVFADGNWIETKDQSADGIRLVQTGNVGEGVFKDRRDKARWISEETFARLNCFEVLPGDILISRLPDPVGRGCLIPETGDKMITAVDCTVVRLDETKVDPAYFVYLTQSSEYLKDVDEVCTGTTRRRISRKNLGKVLMPLPPLDEQIGIVEKLNRVRAEVDAAFEHYRAQISNLEELNQSLLQKAFAGELT